MPVTINASTSTGLVQSADTSGEIQLQSNGTTELTVTSTGVTVADNLLFNSGYGSAATAYGCRAWVNYNGVANTIRASGNVSSVTDNGAGDYTVNFSTAMPDANYSIVGTGGDAGVWGTLVHTAGNVSGGGTNPTASSCRMLASNNFTTGRVDDGFVNIAVFR